MTSIKISEKNSIFFVLFLSIVYLASSTSCTKLKKILNQNFEDHIEYVKKNLIKDEVFYNNLKNERNYEQLKLFYKKGLVYLIDGEDQLKQTNDALKYYNKVIAHNDLEIMGAKQDQLKLEMDNVEKSLKYFFKTNPTEEKRVIDVAAGFGRYIKYVFPKYFNKIDFVEPIDNQFEYLKKLKQNIPQIDKMDKKTCQDYEFTKEYDLIFVSSLLDTLTDLQYLKFLIKARKALKKNGILILLENAHQFYRTTIEKKIYFDSSTSQRIRYVDIHLLFFKLAGFTPIIVGDILKFENDVEFFKFFLEKTDN